MMRKALLKYTVLTLCNLLVISVAVQAQATYEITGTVYNRETDETLPSATVRIVGMQQGSFTNSNGKYNLELEPGNYQLAATFVGFKPDTVSISVEAGKEHQYDFYLESQVIEGEDVVVYADRVGQRVVELAQLRNERRETLENYSVMVHKLGLLYEMGKESRKSTVTIENTGSSAGNSAAFRSMLNEPAIRSNSSKADSSEAIAFSERLVEQIYIDPNRFAERYVARRSSDNFFSEHEIFSTGGSPLDLNEDKVDINILAEVVSVVGPISEKATDFYYYDDEPAGDDWPEGTTKITLDPKSKSRPLFTGVVYINDETNDVIGMDLELNEAGSVSSGVYSLSDFQYYQKYEKIGDYWLPSRTEIQARIGVIGFNNDFVYHDRWVYDNYKINQQNLSKSAIPLSGSIVEKKAGSRDTEYWQNIKQQYFDSRDQQEVEQAETYEENRFIVNFFMSAFQTYHQAPTYIRNSYFTNFSDYYRFNKVEGHYFGLGLRNPAVQDNYTYKGSIGYATEADDWRYYLEGSHFIPGTNLAVEGGYYNKLAIQFADYPYQVSPLNIDELRYTLTAGLAGYDPRSYFEREGFKTGLRYQIRPNFFLRANYMNEDQSFLPTVFTNNFFGSTMVKDFGGTDHNLNPDVGRTPQNINPSSELEGFTEGTFSGFEFHLHFDNRQYRTGGIFRNYLVRKFGWFTDHLAYWSDPSFGSDGTETFNYFKYRSSVGMRIPMFASHFLFTSFYVGGSDNPLPAQMQFSNNGFYIEDYLRRRPFLSLGFNEAIGNRITAAKLDYNFGTALVRSLPINAIRHSGVGFRVWGSGGLRHDEADLSPITPWTNGVEEHIEVGAAVTRIMGLFSIDVSFRLKGDVGSKFGLSFII